MLGVGDFYYELGVQIVELGVATSHLNGGVLPMDEVLRKLNSRRRPENKISVDDVSRAIKKLNVLGSGLEMIESGSSRFVCTIPGDLSMDHSVILQLAEKNGSLSVSTTSQELCWTSERASRGLDHLLRVGVAWRDDQDNPASYWFPAFFQQQTRNGNLYSNAMLSIFS